MIRFLLFFSFVSAHSFGSEDKNLTKYYEEIFIGEKKTSNYYGPLDPRSIEGKRSGELIFLDDKFSEQYINEQIQTEAFALHDFWFKKITEESTCPNSVLAENVEYIRYLYRLLTISYLFEGIKINNKLSMELGFKNICELTYKKNFEQCRPQSADMKRFHERVYGKLIKEIEKIKHETLSKKESKKWLDDFHLSNSLTSNPTMARLHEWCIGNKKNCRDLQKDEIYSALNSFCESDTKSIQKICSEKDDLYGVASISMASQLIKNSNAFNLINQSGMGEDCLRRYGKIFQIKESDQSLLAKQFPLLFSYLLNNKSRYLQGELFLPGALKEFDMKGMSDFLTALRPPELVVIKTPPPKMQKPISKIISKKKEIIFENKKNEEKIIPATEPVAVPHVSEFERAARELKTKGLSFVEIDMDLFRDDFEFTSNMVSELSGPIKKFQTRAALNDMKSYDHLGTMEAPLGLIFLKFLIDTENHQGLYNIISILGESFYVNNDTEKKREPHLVQLKNDSSTKNRWQIILINKKIP